MHNNHVKADLTGLNADPASIKHGSPTVHAAVRITRGAARCTYSTGRLFLASGGCDGAMTSSSTLTTAGCSRPAPGKPLTNRVNVARLRTVVAASARASLTLRHQSKPQGARVGGAPCQRGAGDVASNIACQCASDVDLLRDLNAYTPGMDRRLSQ